MKKEKEFRSSTHQAQFAAFLDSPTGQEFLRVLEGDARPSIAAMAQHGTHEDVKFQMALNLVASIEKFSIVDKIKRMALPPSDKGGPKFEPLEDEDLEQPRENKKK